METVLLIGVKIAYNVKGKERRELAQAVGDALKTVPVYKKAPSYAYEIGDCVVDRQGTLQIGRSLDSEMVNLLLTHLEERGFEGKNAETSSQEQSGLVISTPRDTFTNQALENLLRLGYIGSEYKTIRKILLRNLTGDSAFRYGARKL